MACDGLWKVFSTDEAAAFVTSVLEVSFLRRWPHDQLMIILQDPTIQLPDGTFMFNFTVED